MNLTTFTLQALLLTAGLSETKMDIAEDNVPAEVDLSQLAEAALASVNEVHLLRAYIEANIPVLLVPESEAEFMDENFEDIGAATMVFFSQGSPLALLHHSNRPGEYFLLVGSGGIRRLIENLQDIFRRRPKRTLSTLGTADSVRRASRHTRNSCFSRMLQRIGYPNFREAPGYDVCSVALNMVITCLDNARPSHEIRNIEDIRDTRHDLELFNICRGFIF